MKNNPYIERIATIPQILQNEDVFQKKGKWNEFFENNFPIYLEIGTWWWGFFSDQCGKYQNVNHIGMEIKYKRLFKTHQKAQQIGQNNFVLLKAFWQQIGEIFWPEELTQTRVLFPDPWHTKKHRKKHKLIQTEFLETLFFCTKPGGLLHIKTDHEEYFSQILEAFVPTKWETVYISHDFKNLPDMPQKHTEFEQLFRQKSLAIRYGIFQKTMDREKTIDIHDFFV